MNAEQLRLKEAKDKQVPWRKWGPYLSERQWVRYEKTIARMVMPGITSLMIRHAPGLIIGGDGLGGICDDI